MKGPGITPGYQLLMEVNGMKPATGSDPESVWSLWSTANVRGGDTI